MPLTVTDAPAAPELGERLEILGVGSTVKLTPLLACPETVTTTFPVVAPLGTAAVMLVVVQLVVVAVVPLNFTLLPVDDPNVVPAIVIDAPIAADEGVKLLMCGVTVKLFPLLETPPTFTTTFPVVAVAGTFALMVPEPQLTTVVAVTPLNVTVLLPCVDPKFEPEIVTVVPTGPEVGERLEMVGAAALDATANTDTKTIPRTIRRALKMVTTAILRKTLLSVARWR